MLRDRRQEAPARDDKLGMLDQGEIRTWKYETDDSNSMRPYVLGFNIKKQLETILILQG
jgi:hypothetical protein